MDKSFPTLFSYSQCCYPRKMIPMLQYLLEMYSITCIKKSKYSSFNRIMFQHILKLRNKWLVTLVHQLCDVRVEISAILLIFPLGSQNVAALLSIPEGRQSVSRREVSPLLSSAFIHIEMFPCTPQADFQNISFGQSGSHAHL